ncbi:MAG: PEP-CTERM sorting domain-containing protein [Desulfobacteraceae bacterium]|nr:PEP-CTERM sorting domain-containing protein [Desulfobacteraceae bacterium]
MIKLYKNHLILLLVLIFLTAPFQVFAAGVVLPDATQIADSGSASVPALWWLDHNTVTPASDRFIMGGFGKSYNQLNIDANYSFTASNGLLVGANNSFHNLLNIQSGGHVTVSGNLQVGDGSTMYYGRYNKINVSGSNAVLAVNGNLNLWDGYNATDNIIGLNDGGIAVVDGDFSLYNHWTYGNSWLELDGGTLFLSGDKTTDFDYGEGILSSIKVWDELSGAFQRVAEYDYTTWEATEYLDLLAVDYIQDSAQAASLGFSDDYIGFTAVHNVSSVPIPGALWLFASGLIGFVGYRRKNN